MKVLREEDSWIAKLLAAKKTDAPSEGTPVVDAVGEEVGGVDVIVHEDKVLAGGDIVEAPTNSPVVPESVESFLHVCVQREPDREAARTWGSTNCCWSLTTLKGTPVWISEEYARSKPFTNGNRP